MFAARLLAVAGALSPALVAAQENLAERAVDCVFSIAPSRGATCQSFASAWGISVETLQKLNPGITCPQLDDQQNYCVIGTADEPPKPTTSSTSTTAKPSEPTPSPTMPGLASNCDAFHKVASGDNCAAIATKYGISGAQFSSWNSEIDKDCTNLWLGYYVCVHVAGASTGVPTPTSLPPQPTGTGPEPQMPGIISGCKKFHQVKSGDSCWSIFSGAGITFDQFLEYNTEIDSGCGNLWLGYYVCTGV
ncbi:uncharacterized protein B0I36DRAFT_410324 [Microdochium trichocladiopsis]|uniref:LysM domain-containing protein n=1 Tax=Microdochium trichocladiopsis TaxID=1682393 RepID=A0A9P9BP89_9PEZI|nr:uncharacterized protein B0I36DRAFT_410324 [Microdochium trichocladiopsis]KAH7028810.1 hypothetical protein B0I36DRAFT_410324 [Microdochium trichocladiopsis]